jgi:hypothetical protein
MDIPGFQIGNMKISFPLQGTEGSNQNEGTD